jgi:CO dehydrogenase maturation factor
MAKSIAIAGKGGTGKSTIAASIILYLRANKMGPVLAIDADPDANLGTLLGLEPRQAIGDLREEVLREIKNFPAGMSKANYVEAGLHQVIEESEGFDLITMGRGEGPGCYCYLNSLIRKFYDDLMPSYSWVVIDNEAGLEHISRRTTSNIDALLVVVDSNPNSLKTASRIEQITNDLKNIVHKKFLITNRIDSLRRERVMNFVSRELSLKHLCDIPFDPGLEDFVFNGGSLKDFTHSLVMDQIRLIVENIQ